MRWLRRTASRYRRHRQVLRNEKKAMRELKQWMRENP